MKKVVLIALVVVMALGCVSAFAAPKKTSGVETIENGRTICPNSINGMYMAWLRNGENPGGWGGGDQWSPKTGVTEQDCTLGLQGTFMMEGVEYPEIERLGYVIEGAEDTIIWFDSFTLKRADEMDADFAFMKLESLQAGNGVAVETSIDTSTMKAGEYNIKLVFQYEGDYYTWAQNEFGDGQWVVTTIRSTGKNYVEPVEDNGEEPVGPSKPSDEPTQPEEPKKTGDVSILVAIVAVAALAVVVLKKRENA